MLTTLLQEAVVRTKLHPAGALVSFLFLLVLGQQRLPAAVAAVAAAANFVPVGRIFAAEDSRAAANADSHLRCLASSGAAFFVVVVVVVAPAERQQCRRRRPHSGGKQSQIAQALVIPRNLGLAERQILVGLFLLVFLHST